MNSLWLPVFFRWPVLAGKNGGIALVICLCCFFVVFLNVFGFCFNVLLMMMRRRMIMRMMMIIIIICIIIITIIIVMMMIRYSFPSIVFVSCVHVLV